jgi:phosphonate transport system substrate-binding protein
MSKQKHVLPFVAVLSAIALLLSACGAQPTATAPTAAAPAAATAAPAAATAAPAAATAAPAAATTAPAAPAADAVVAPTAPAVNVSDKAGWPDPFRIGLFAGDDANAAIQNAQPLKQLFEEKLGVQVEITTGTSYSAVIEAMRAGRVDAMEVGPFAYVLAVQEAQAEAIAVSMNTPDDKPVYDPAMAPAYYSVFFTKKGSGITTDVQTLKDKTFAFVDAASTSGHLAPKTALIKAGINPDTDMKSTFAGSHPSAVLSVWNDTTQAGATFEGNLYRLANQGQIQFCSFPDGRQGVARSQADVQKLYDECPDGHIVMLGYSDPIPNTPFAVSNKLPESFKTAVRDTLLSTPSNPEFIKAYGAFYSYPVQQMGLPSLDAYYNSLRDIAQLLNLDLKELAR